MLARGRKNSTLCWMTLAFVCLSFILTPVAHALETVKRYQVMEDDTVLDLADRFLDDPYRWPEVFAAQDNEHHLYPGDVLEISNRQSGVLIEKITQPESVTLSPTIRVNQAYKAIPTIPMQMIAPFLNESRILSEPLGDEVPTVIGVEGSHLEGAAHQYIYASGLEDSNTTEFDIVEIGRGAKQVSQNGELLGYEAKILAKARMVKRDKVSALYVPISYREIVMGSKLLPSDDEHVRADFVLQYPSVDAGGEIISVLNGVSDVGRFSVVTISGGIDIGRVAGDLLNIYKPGSTMPNSLEFRSEKKSMTYPLVKAGTAIVFSVYDKASFAVVVEANDFITLNAMVGGF